MTDDELRAAIAATGHGRYRYLTTDHPDPKVRAAYRAIVREIAAEGRPPAASVPPDYADRLPPLGGCCGG